MQYRMNEPSVASETIDGEVVIINLETGTYFSLTFVASQIWELLGRGMTAKQIVDQIDSKYNSNGVDLTHTVETFIDSLIEEKLIVEAIDSEQSDPELNPISTDGHASTDKLPFTAPVLSKFTDMQELLFLDPIHEVDESGWPNMKEQADGRQADSTRAPEDA